MIDFACKRFDLEEVIRCSLDLTKTEFKIIKYLIEYDDKAFTPGELAKIFQIGLSTSQKIIRNIYQKGLVKRNQKNLNTGGYVFVYSIKEKSFLKQKILSIIYNWIKKVETELKKW